MTLQQVLTDIGFVAEHWPHLQDTLTPGTARPWQPPQISPERREQLEHEARIERLERVDVAPGEHPTPIRPDVHDTMVTICETAARLAPQIAGDAGCPLIMPSPYARGPAAALAHITWHLQVPTPRPVDEELVDQAAFEFRGLARDVALTLRLLRDGQTLDAGCPWCRMPRALVVRDDPTLGVTLIVCTSRIPCQPPDPDCGTRVRGRPAWPQYEWDWLARRIRHADRLGHLGRPIPEHARQATADRHAHEAAARRLWQPDNPTGRTA